MEKTAKRRTLKMSVKSARWHSARSSERSFFEYERTPFTSVSLGALNYIPTERIVQLARHKIRRDTTIKENGFSRYYSDPTYSGVSKPALIGVCSERVKELALPPKRHSSFKYESPVMRPVSHRAMKYQPSERILELATPIKR